MPKIIGYSVSEENFPGADMTADEWEFVHAMEQYQRKYERRYPSWREAFRVLLSLGYRKSEPPTAWPAKPVYKRTRPPEPPPADSPSPS